MSENTNICAICKVPATQICAGCKHVYYCNRDHQKKHWKQDHKNNCVPYKIITSESGHQLVATRDIKQNEIILKETPLVIGPGKTSSVICLGCNRHIGKNHGEEYRCKNCNWPVCGKKCQEALLHKQECNLMKEKGYKADSEPSNSKKSICYLPIVTLRCLLLKSTGKSKYDAIMSLYSRTPSNKQLEIIKSTVVTVIQNDLKLDFSENEIVKMAHIFDIYSQDILKEGKISCKGLYRLTALVAHDCKPNTAFSIHGISHQLVLRATTPIAKGDQITTTYAETLWGTLSRRAHLLETKNIICNCLRCKDSSEFGTYLGSIYCYKCKISNENTCPKIISSDPLNPIAIWKCEKCSHTIRGRQMVWGNEAIKNEINRIDRKNPLNLEQFLVKYKDTLHPKNYHAIVAKYALCQIYGNSPGFSYVDLTDEIIERKVDICHELLEVIDVLDPGYSKLRGSLLYDLQTAMVVQTKRELNKGNITKAAAQESLTQCLAILKEAIQILSSEPDTKEYLEDQLEKLCKELDFE